MTHGQVAQDKRNCRQGTGRGETTWRHLTLAAQGSKGTVDRRTTHVRDPPRPFSNHLSSFPLRVHKEGTRDGVHRWDRCRRRQSTEVETGLSTEVPRSKTTRLDQGPKSFMKKEKNKEVDPTGIRGRSPREGLGCNLPRRIRFVCVYWLDFLSTNGDTELKDVVQTCRTRHWDLKTRRPIVSYPGSFHETVWRTGHRSFVFCWRRLTVIHKTQHNDDYNPHLRRNYTTLLDFHLRESVFSPVLLIEQLEKRVCRTQVI